MEDPTSPPPKPQRDPRMIVVGLTTIGAGVFAIAYAMLAYDARSAFADGSRYALVVAAGLFGVVTAAGATAIRLFAERKRLENELDGKERAEVGLRHRLADAEAERRETDTIVRAVPTNLLVIDKSLLIQSSYMGDLESTLFAGKLLGENFLNVLQRLLADRLFRASRDYLSLLFDGSKKERTVVSVNPLEEVEVHVGSGSDRAVTYLSFAFRRIVEAGTIARALVTIDDVTERVLRERTLRESEKQNLKQFEPLIGILHAPAAALDDFVAVAKEQLHEADEALRAQDFAGAGFGQTALLQQRLDGVMRAIHNIKGNATLLRLNHFERKAGAYEAKIVDLRNRPALGGEDFLSLVIEQSDLRADIDDLQMLRVKLAGLQRSAAIEAQSGDDLVTSVSSLAKQLAARQQKEVRIDAEGFDSRDLPTGLRTILRDVLIQLTRNSVSHGIEPAAIRESLGKPRVATIAIHPVRPQAPGSFGFTYRDDGRGLDAGAIRARAVSLGLVEAGAAAAIDDSEIAGFIFSPGFSTATLSGDAGRGMGMNVVKKRIVDEAGGEIAMNSEAGTFCEFIFAVPTANVVSA